MRRFGASPVALELEGDPLLGIHPETSALYRSLVSRSATSSAILGDDACAKEHREHPFIERQPKNRHPAIRVVERGRGPRPRPVEPRHISSMDAPWATFDRLRREAPVHWNAEPAPNHGFWSITRATRTSLRWIGTTATFSSERGAVSLEELDLEQLRAPEVDDRYRRRPPRRAPATASA